MNSARRATASEQHNVTVCKRVKDNPKSIFIHNIGGRCQNGASCRPGRAIAGGRGQRNDDSKRDEKLTSSNNHDDDGSRLISGTLRRTD